MMSTIKKLTQKDKELVAVAASIASGCLPCTTHHIKLVREAGAAETEVLRAIDIALDVRNNSTEIITEAARGNPDNDYPIKMQSASLEQPIDDLISMGAALASNSVAGLEYYLIMAWAAGASPRQIQTAVEVARTIRKEAAEKADAIIGSPIEPARVMTDDQPGGYYQKADDRVLKRSNKNGMMNTDKQKENAPPPCACN
jgi:AhpD family alkylhydroperoxidase